MKRLFFALMLMGATLCAPAQLLYRISGKGLPTPSYIVGTYHLANVAFVDSIPGIRQAMADCQQVYGELIIDEMQSPDTLAMMQQAMLLPEGMTLDKLLTADEMNRLNAYMKSLLGMDMTNPLIAQEMGKWTPSALSTTLSSLTFLKKTSGYDLQNQFDNYFQKEAFKQGKGVGGLETTLFQLNMLFKSQTLERQKELLMCQVDNVAFMDEMTDKLNNSCDSRPEEEDALIYNRNADWVKKMPALMTKMPTLFAVGAAHLPGEKGVLNLLRQAGYKVEGVTK